MKTCSKCGLTKDFDSFNKSSRNKDGLHAYCRDCQKAHYHSNADRHKANVRKSRVRYTKAARSKVVDALSGGCVDCGLKDIRVLDFDHVGVDKEFNVMDMVRKGYAISRVLDEIKKCEVRCKNCHAIKTYERLGGSWRDAPVTESGFYPVNRSGVENVGSNPTGGTPA